MLVSAISSTRPATFLASMLIPFKSKPHCSRIVPYPALKSNRYVKLRQEDRAGLLSVRCRRLPSTQSENSSGKWRGESFHHAIVAPGDVSSRQLPLQRKEARLWRYPPIPTIPSRRLRTRRAS